MTRLEDRPGPPPPHPDGVIAEYRIRPVRVDKHVQLMSTESIALYEELTGVRLGYAPGPLKAALPPSRPRGMRLASCTPATR